MANFLNTRIRLKYDTYQNWYNNNPTLLSGELAIVEVPNSDQMAGDSVKPQILFKVGPGAFNSLPWASAKAADVHAWAKAEKLTIEKAAGQTGNVVSGISWDATNNKVTYTTASVATSEGLKDIQDRVGALETKEDKDTTYTFAQTTKGFSITPKGGSAQTITFDYLTPTEIANAYVNLTGAQTITGFKTFADEVSVTYGYDSDAFNKASYCADGIYTQTEEEEYFYAFPQDNGTIALREDISDALGSYYKKTEVDSNFATKQYVDTTADNINQAMDDLDGALTDLDTKVSDKVDKSQIHTGTDQPRQGDLVTYDFISNNFDYKNAASAVENRVNEAIDDLSKEVEANAIAIEALTNGTSTEEIDSVMELVDYVNEHGTEVQGMKNDIKANADAIDVIEAKPAMGITAQNITNWNNAHSANHSHSNKTVLDGITSAKVSNWDTAATNNHTHSNKTVLDDISTTKVSNWDDAAGKKHSHENKALLDTYTQTEANLADAVSKKHSHENKSVIDGITAAQVSNWNDAYTLLNTDYGFVQTVEIYDNGAKHEYGLSVYRENNEEGTENIIKLDDIKLNTGSYIGKTLGTFVSDVTNKKTVEYYDATTEDYSKGSFIICCGTSSKLV